MNKRKGTPCSCESDTLRCGNKVRKIDGISPDPNGEFYIEAGNGITISTGENKITIVNDAIASSFVAGDNIEINPSGDNLEIRVKDDVSIDNLDVSQDVDVTGDVNVTNDVNVSNDVNIGGDLKVTGDIIQQGSSYETHAEQVYTTKDYIYMREGAVSGLSPGDYSGFEVIKYDGTNDGRLVIDNDGVARVGDVGDEQPLLTREESANLTDGALLKWDGINFKAVDEGTVGTDTKPIKIVNGVATAVTKDVITVDGGRLNRNKPIIYDVDPYNAGIQINANSSNGNNIQIMNIYDNNGQSLMGLYLTYDSTNGVRLNASLRNANGTYRYSLIV